MTNVYDACHDEVIRQGFTGFEANERTWRLIEAYYTARDSQTIRLWFGWLNNLALIIEPTNKGVFRKTPVSFADLSTAVSPTNVDAAMEQWVKTFNDEVFYYKQKSGIDASIITKNFLDIHPYSDGNGRLGFILYNWILGFPNDVKPLPDFYGGDT